MKSIRIVKKISDYKVTNQDIRNIEKEKNCTLPQDYKDFLLTYNGGKPYWNSFEVKGESINGKSSFDSVRFFYGICSDENSVMYTYDIFDNMKCYDNRVPKELLPIATDSFDNNICLCVKGNNYGKLYFWDHENEQMDPKKEPWWKNIYLIANSFSEFLENMSRFDIDDNDNKISHFQDGRIEVTPSQGNKKLK